MNKFEVGQHIRERDRGRVWRIESVYDTAYGIRRVMKSGRVSGSSYALSFLNLEHNPNRYEVVAAPGSCGACDCADPTTDPNLAAECDCECHERIQYGFSWFSGGRIPVTAWHTQFDAARAGVRSVARQGYGTSAILTRSRAR